MIALVGFMGAGKTTVGGLLSIRLGTPFVDSDALIEQRLGRTIRSIFDAEGESHFRDIERATVTELVLGDDAVIALGGGAVQDARTRATLARATVIYLAVGYDEARARVRDDGLRPMLDRARLADLYEERVAGYEEVAAITVSTDGRAPGEIVDDLLVQLNGVS